MTIGADDVRAIVALAIAEDVGPADWTTLWTVPPDRLARAQIVARSPGVIAGMEAGLLTLDLIDRSLRADIRAGDGAAVAAGETVMRVEGSARSILTAERVTLNFLQRLSGVATLTRLYADAVRGTDATILDTRKTTPGMRALEKRAVVVGGGANHRFGLHDMVLIKENHIRAAGGIVAAIEAVRANDRLGLALEVEVTNLDEARQALAAGIDRILFDNMSVDELRAGVALVRASSTSVETEASGGVTLENVRGIAETGVDFISVGALTHSAPALDLSLLLED